MSKVIPFSQIRKTKEKKIYGYLESAGIEKYEALVEVEAGILEYLYVETEAFLKENGFDVKQFTLDEHSAREFLAVDFMEALEGGEEELCISYIAHIDGVEYRTLAQADFVGENEVEFDVNIYKRADDGEWLSYEGKDCWVEGAGKDFF